MQVLRNSVKESLNESGASSLCMSQCEVIEEQKDLE